MKLGLLGDIHANRLALAVVLDAATKANVDALLITGDLVGYYFSPKAILELLQPWERYTVRGNHEEMLSRCRLNPEALSAVRNRYGSGIDEALAQLSTAELDVLCGLPHPLPLVFDGRKVLLCHGAPHEIDCYVYPDSDLAVLDGAALTEFDLVVTGHTHYPMQKTLGEKTLLVNPGSVGQPRNRVPGAHWAIFDTVSRDVEFRMEPYDPSALVRECELRHPELPYLSEVLLRK